MTTNSPSSAPGTLRLLEAREAARLRDRINADGTFAQVSRDMTLDVAIEIGADARLFRFRDGVLTHIAPFVAMTEPVDIVISGDGDFWRKMLLPLPPPRFQNLYAALRAETCQVRGNGELYNAYFAAITRMVELMRDHENDPRAA